MIQPTILPDWIVDAYISSPTKYSLYFHHLKNRASMYEVSLKYCKESKLNEAFNTIFILGSQNHHVLFEAIQTQFVKNFNDKRVYPHLTMKILNETVLKLRGNHSEVAKIRKIIGENYVLPLCFQACIFYLPILCFTVIDSKIVRCHTNVQMPNVAKWSCTYNIQEDILGKLGSCETASSLGIKSSLETTCSRDTKSSPLSRVQKQARNFESKHAEKYLLSSPWPYTLSNNDPPWQPVSMFQKSNTHPLICIEIQDVTMILEFISKWEEYLKSLIMFDKDNCLNKYRHQNQKQSKHIPNIHGQTFYGHYLETNFDLFKILESVLKQLCLMEKCLVSTCYLSVQFDANFKLFEKQ